MVGHQITSGSGDNLPGDLSYTVVTQWLREDLQYDGIAITDAQNMGAITDNYTAGEAAVMAVEAGIDMILMPDDLTSAVSAVIAAVKNRTISEECINESVGRILTQKEKMDLLS